MNWELVIEKKEVIIVLDQIILKMLIIEVMESIMDLIMGVVYLSFRSFVIGYQRRMVLMLLNRLLMLYIVELIVQSRMLYYVMK